MGNTSGIDTTITTRVGVPATWTLAEENTDILDVTTGTSTWWIGRVPAASPVSILYATSVQFGTGHNAWTLKIKDENGTVLREDDVQNQDILLYYLVAEGGFAVDYPTRLLSTSWTPVRLQIFTWNPHVDPMSLSPKFQVTLQDRRGTGSQTFRFTSRRFWTHTCPE